MHSLRDVAFGLVAGVFGWLLTELLAKPFRRGLDLVAETRQAMIIFANVQARARQSGALIEALAPMPPEAAERLASAEKTYRDLAAKLLAFAQIEPVASAALALVGLRLKSAGEALLGLSNSVGVYGPDRNEFTRRAERSLRVPS